VFVLDSVTCADTFPQDGQTGGAQIVAQNGSNGGYFTVTGNDAYVQLGYSPDGHGVFVEWTPAVHVGTGNGILAAGTRGIRFRNYTAGSVATVSAGLSEPAEPALQLTSAGVTSSAATVVNLATSLPAATDGVEVVLTDSLTAPTYMWRLRYIAAATKWLPQAGSWGYGTVLPTVPALVDKVMFELVDNVITPTYSWQLRYNSGSANTDKWEYVGGSPGNAIVTTLETTASIAYTALATAGPSFTCPRAGVYDIYSGAQMGNVTAGDFAIMSYDIGGTGAVDGDGIWSLDRVNAGLNGAAHHFRIKRQARFTAGTTALVAKYRAVTAGTASFADRSLTVVPVRLS
jgi:hypothetical protein